MRSGFTLIELLLVLVLVGLLAAVALPFMPSAAVLQLSQQAVNLAADLRHAQALALTGGERLCFVSLAGAYRVSRYDAGAAVCLAVPLPDPASGQVFERSLPPGIAFEAASLGTLQFDTLGRPIDSAGVPLEADPARHYVLRAGNASSSVTVQALTGRVSP